MSQIEDYLAIVTTWPENKVFYVTLTLETNKTGKTEWCRIEGYHQVDQNLKRQADLIRGKWVDLRVTENDSNGRIDHHTGLVARKTLIKQQPKFQKLLGRNPVCTECVLCFTDSRSLLSL